MSNFKFMLPLAVVVIVLVDKTHGISIDEMIVDAANSSQQFDFFYDDNSGLVKTELDILLSYEEYDRFQNQTDVEDDDDGDDSGSRKKRTTALKVRPYYSQRWENNIVYYQHTVSFTSKEMTEFNAAIKEWERYTCLRFIQSTTAKNRILVGSGGGCSSRIGMSGGTQPLSLGGGCRRKPIIVHELGHAIGLFHEQTRPDRDRYVNIIRANINPQMFYNFKIKTNEAVETYGLPYDYMSIMHYGKTSFTVNGRTTIQTTDPAYQNLIGQVHVLSFLDIQTVNKMYNCREHTNGCTKTDAQCPNNGFVGKDCTCWCRGELNNREDAVPVKPCSNTGPRPTPKPTPRPTPRPTPKPTPRPTQKPTTNCRDNHKNCAYWARKGECNANPAWMHPNCKKSCNKCGGTVVSSCQDTHEACPKWKKMNYCNVRYVDIVRPACKKSCGLCGTPSCEDTHEACPKWKKMNYCNVRYADIVRPACKKSCGLCGTGYSHHKAPAPSTKSNSRCRNRNPHCKSWASSGECTANPAYMSVHCRRACGLKC